MSIPTKHTDVLIIGAGPGGASMALSLLNYSNYSVALVEQTDFNQTRVGEHVSASIFDLISYLKINKSDFEDQSFIAVHATKTYWGSKQPNITNSIFTTDEATFQLDREKFDLKLIEVASDRGATIYPRSKCTQYKQLEDKTWEVNVNHQTQGQFTISANYLVDASGRTGNVCRQVGVPSKKYDSLMGVGLFLERDKNTSGFEQTIETTQWGWWYTACLPANKVIATFFTDADIISKNKLHRIENWSKHLQSSHYIKELLSGSRSSTKELWVRNAQTQISDTTNLDRFLAIGDAAVSFDPLSSMGIGFSISSAFHAAKHIENELGQKRFTKAIFQQDIIRTFDQYLHLRKRYYQEEKRWANSTFWKRRNQD